MKHIPLATGHPVGTEQKYIKEAFDTNWIAPLGPHVDAFESTMADYIGRKYAAATSSGTGAIHLALIDAGVQPGDIVFSSDMTFAATCNPARYLGAKIVFIDSNEETFNIDVMSLEKAFKKYKKVKCLVVAHLYGQSCDMDPILELCKQYNCILIEDAAEALGSTYKGKKCGSFGDYSCLSFNGNKIITTSGGGMVFSNNKEKVKHMRFLSTQARDPAPWYQHSELGYNYRMSNICAAIGRAQFEDLKNRINKKRRIYLRYKEGLKDTKAYMMPLADYGESNCWLSVMLIKKGINKSPIGLLNFLKEHGVESRPIWKPMHMQPLYKDYDFVSICEYNPMDEDIFARGLCLPSDIMMTDEEQNYVIGLINDYLIDNES